ncbi:hypothetical protein LSH36_12g17020 [Paralvinella palmiformis]|uniref:3-oxoacyl-[acyl-carrier-protein] synthase n=1 Tax=Paralvinella palmiformis TaxID=53620 RepID=A0AAD9KE82_9ANNE|nr:hypothetical protein LSH36_12g17020 [Paralvinella palmiformis]
MGLLWSTISSCANDIAFISQMNQLLFHRTSRQLSRGNLSRRVVVTGLGLVTCLGVGVPYVWNRLIRGDCGLHKLESKEYDHIPCKVAGKVPIGDEEGQLNISAYISKSDERCMSLPVCYALIAADEAIKQSGWMPETNDDFCRTGVAVGMGMVPLNEIVDAGRNLYDVSYNRVSPYFVPKILINMAAGHISLKYGFKGVNHSVSTACATGAHSVGDAARFIQYGDVDVMVCGGAEACINPLAVAGFARMRALSTRFNDSPRKASRPFDKDRDGFVMSEGAGVVVLEELDHAMKRSATIYGEILGYGLSGDANHITVPSKTGDGALLCMKAALRDAGIKAQEIGYINAHATSTPIGDAVECRAINELLGSESKCAVSSTKGAVGHLLGAAGSVEAVFTLMACYTGQLPPTINCNQPDGEFDLNFIPNISQAWPDTRRIAITNSFGFGGTNAALCISNHR